MNEQQENEIIQRAKDGDEDAFQLLFERYWMDVFHYLLHKLRNRAIAEEETQEVFLKAWEKLHTLREEDKFRNWLRKIAKTHYLNVLRKQRRRLHAKSMTDMQPEGYTSEEGADFNSKLFGADDDANPEEVLLSKEQGEIIRAAVAQLPDLWREAFVLGCIEGFSESEGARIMGCSITQFRGYKRRALERLRQILAPNSN